MSGFEVWYKRFFKKEITDLKCISLFYPGGPLECQEGVSGSSKNSRKKGPFSQSSTVRA